MGSLQHMATMLAAPGGQQASSAKGAFGAHSGIPTSSSTTPSLQTLSGAMAMAMEGSVGQSRSSLFGGSSSLGGGYSSSNANSLGDAMGLSPYKSSNNGDSGYGGSSLLYKGSSALNDSSAKGNSWGVESLGGGMYGAQEQQEAVVDGALELSAGAKPFVPRFGSAALGGGAPPATNPAGSLGSASPLTGPLSGSLSGPLTGGPLGSASPLTGPLSSAFGGPLSSSALGGLSLSSGLTGGLTGSPWGSSTSLSMDAVKSTESQSNISSYLSNLLSSDLNLDEDNYEYGDASNIIPDLDSFLLNDN